MDEHRCGHPNGKFHSCGCDEPKSHRASKIDCQEFYDRPMVFLYPEDPLTADSAYVKVKEMDDAAAKHLGQVER